MSSLLIVDDRPANLRALEATLAPLGQRIVSATSGAEALKQLLDPDEFAVVLMDVRMPEIDGFETVRMLRGRERTRRLPVIFISGYAPDEEIIAQSYRYGSIADFVLKPYNPHVLRAKVALFVELQQMREELKQHARREAERAAVDAERRRLYALFQKAPAAIAVLNGRTHTYEFFNEMFASAFAGGDAVLGKPASQHLPALAGESFLERLDRVVASGEAAVVDEVRAGDRVFSLMFQPEHTRDRVEGVIVFGVDITDQVSARALRERLLAIISHDLRNPLSAVSMGVDVLLRRQPTERDAATLRRLKASAARMNRLVDQLLDFAALQQGGGVRLARANIDLNEIVSQTADELNLAYPERPVAVELNGDTRLEGDADRLAQVTSNLIGNAILHGDGHGVVVKVHGDADQVTVRVQNGGAPIPPDVLPTIFDAYRRADDDVPPAVRSLGLGLYIAREILAAHDGSIEARSPDEDEKTSFILHLPRRAAARD